MKWKEMQLIDVSANIQTGPFGSQLHQSDYSQIGIPVVMPKDIINFIISETSISRVSFDHVERLSRHKIVAGDILYSRRGDVGRCAIATKKEEGWLCGTGCLRATIDIIKANPRFIFYQLQKAETVGWVEKHAVGATMLNLNTSILSNIPIELPDLLTQNKIVQILSAYDDLIENNQKQIKLLEEAAQRLYKEWFVDLRFPGYETTPIVDGIPQGWRKEKAEEFFEITIGKTPPRDETNWFSTCEGIPWVSISDMGNCDTCIFETKERLTEDAIKKYNIKIIPHNTILLSFKLTIGRVSITTINMCSNEAIAHFHINDDSLREYTYCFLNNFHYNELGSTSSISQAINSKIVKAMPFIMPSQETVLQFSRTTKPLFDDIQNKQYANIQLKQARDRLLPKLMSGEIEVSYAE